MTLVTNAIERDDRRIDAVTVVGGDFFAAGEGGQIVPTLEPGDGALVVWFAIYKVDELDKGPSVRVNSRHVVAIHYREARP